jgi:hypothetical protein
MQSCAPLSEKVPPRARDVSWVELLDELAVQVGSMQNTLRLLGKKSSEWGVWGLEVTLEAFVRELGIQRIASTR